MSYQYKASENDSVVKKLDSSPNVRSPCTPRARAFQESSRITLGEYVLPMKASPSSGQLEGRVSQR